MPYKKGQSGNPKGRPKGSKNRSTTAMREALAAIISNNIGKMEEWLDRIAADDPKSAFQCMVSVMEFNLPKRSRVALAEDDEKPEDDKGEIDINPYLKAALEAVEKSKLEPE